MSYFSNTTTLTGRAARRHNEKRERMEAKQREAAEKLAYWKSLTPEEKARHTATQEAVARIEKNGITIEDLEQQYNLGVQDGRKAGMEQTFETMFATMALALNELHGFDAEQCVEVLNLVHDKTYYALSTDDAIQEAYDKLGLQINFNDDATADVVEVKDD